MVQARGRANVQSTQKCEVNNLFVRSLFQLWQSILSNNICIFIINFWRQYIRCIPCGVFLDIIILPSTRRSPITTDCGIIYRKQTIINHLSSEYHNKCIIAYQKEIEWIKQSYKTSQANYILTLYIIYYKLYIKGK